MASRPNPTLRRTPLRTWRERSGRSYVWLAKRLGVSERTVLRAAAGHPVDAATAAALERETKVPAAEFTRKAER